MNHTIIAKDRTHLLDLIKAEINSNGNKCSLNHIDVSNVINMNYLFKDSDFNGNISKWNTSNVKQMRYMFARSKFNKDISNWDVSNVEDMWGLFSFSKFNGDLSNWQTYNLKSFNTMFEKAKVQIPYWAEFEDPVLRKKAIDSYILSKELGKELEDHEKIRKKIKL